LNPPVAIEIPDEVLEAVAVRAAEIVLERLRKQPANRWLYGAKAAADYLGWPVKRVHNKVTTGGLPHHRSGGRLMFSTTELDRGIREGL
jgi:Helix-turn-helix domain